MLFWLWSNIILYIKKYITMLYIFILVVLTKKINDKKAIMYFNFYKYNKILWISINIS